MSGRLRSAVSRPAVRLAVAGLVLLAAAGWVVQVATADPHGLSVSPAVGPSNADRVEPLFVEGWTGDQAVAWSRDGLRIATAGGFVAGVRIVDSRTGRALGDSDVPGYVDDLAWSPDGTRLAVLTEASPFGPLWAFVLDDRGAVERSWLAHDEVGEGSLAWSPDGQRLATSAQTEIAVWRSSDGQEAYRIENASTHGASLSWSPDGGRLAAGEFGPAVYDAATGGLLWTTSLGYTRENMSQVAWSPRGDLLASADSAGILRMYRADGSPEGEVRAIERLGAAGFGCRLAWSPDASMLAVTATGGTALVAADSLAVLRVLPVTSEGGGLAVAWSPQGDGIAVTVTASLWSLQVWGLRGPSLAGPLVAFGVAWTAGIALAVPRDLRATVRSPRRAAAEAASRDPSLSVGGALLAFAVVASVLGGVAGTAVGRVSDRLAMPSASWFAMSGLLSGALAVPAAFAAVRAFHWGRWSRPPVVPVAERREARTFGYVLLPFLALAGGVYVVWGVGLGSGVPLPALLASGAIPLVLGILLGTGFVLSGRVAEGFPGERRTRAWLGLGASALASVVVFLGMFLLFVLALNALRVPPVGELGAFGFQVFLGFGFVPLLAIAVALASAAAAGGLPVLARFAFPGYARLHGDDVLELDSRRSVLSLVESSPGIHFRELQRRCGLGVGALHYHLGVLERENLVIARREGMWKRFYPSRRAA